MWGKQAIWIYWVGATAVMLGYLLMQLIGDNKTVFLPGQTSHGHHQIELACGACHSDAFAGGEVLQDACINCHGEELKLADDSHPKSKFTDPRNASRVARLDARECIACHVEHKPEITHAMGVTVPEDFCFKCHSDIAEERPSHSGMAFTSCASGGCHNFHDNRALYEDFIAKHLDEKTVLSNAVTNKRTRAEDYISLAGYPRQDFPLQVLTKDGMDAPAVINDEKIVHDWLDTAHSKAGVNCGACHARKDENKNKVWVDKPGHESCNGCHVFETKGFLSGRHGMRLAQNLSPMMPAMAKIEMKTIASNQELSCVACHSAHRFDAKHAEVDACLSCHNDLHSQNYKNSKHYDLWKKELAGGEPGTGVSCSTCHMPRTLQRAGDKDITLVQHNQNDNLRPNEKMIRSVCLGCHGLGFVIDSLASKDLMEKNYSSPPENRISTLELVRERVKQNAHKKGIN